MKSRYRDLQEFWPDYVREHRRPLTRQLHFIGTTNLLIWVFLALMRRSPRRLAFAVASSYALAWIGHFFVERNLPATFRFPLKAGLCDLKMYLLTWKGAMEAEVRKYVESRSI
jgi:hypothetical protein